MSNNNYTQNQIKLNLPDGKKFLIWLSHDVDRVYKKPFHSAMHTLQSLNFKHMADYFKGKNSYWNFEKILEIERSYDVRSTFYFLNESIKFNALNPKTYFLAKNRYTFSDPAIENIIQLIDKSGWGVGLHGSYNSFENEALIKDEKQVLEKIIEYSVDGIRQHYLNLNIPQNWEMQKKADFTYDASFGLSKARGVQCNSEYAESFEVIRWRI